MRRPFNGTVTITQEYGTINAGARRGYHTGNDYALPIGTEILAPSNGVIVRNGDGTASSDGRGYFIVFKGDDGIFHQLFHLKQMGTKQGRVNEGDVIGYSGNTGQSTGPHLHWETTTRDDRTSDFHPKDWLFKSGSISVAVPTPTRATHEYVQVKGDYRTTYRTPGGAKTGQIKPNDFGGILTYAVLARDGVYVQIERQDGSGKQWIYCGADVAYLTTFYWA